MEETRAYEVDETTDFSNLNISIPVDSPEFPEAKRVILGKLYESLKTSLLQDSKAYIDKICLLIPQPRIRIAGLDVNLTYTMPENLKVLNPQVWLFKYSQYSKKKGGNRWAHPASFGVNRKTSWYGGEIQNGMKAITEFPLTHKVTMKPEHWFISRNSGKPLTPEAATANAGSYDNLWNYTDIVCNRRKGLESLKTEMFRFAIVVDNPFAKGADCPFIIGELSEAISFKVQRVNTSENPVKARFALHSQAIRSTFISGK